MSRAEEVLTCLLRAYSVYYNVRRESRLEPFAAEAEFAMHDEQYFLTRAARISEADSREVIFFALAQEPDAEKVTELCALAWKEGLSRVVPGPNHFSTDIGLILLAGRLSEDAAKAVRSFNRTKSFRFGLQGYSRFRMVAYDLTDDITVRNKMGDTLEKVIWDIKKSSF